jgi:hypothetical protein
VEEEAVMYRKTANQNILIYGGIFLLAFAVVFISCLNPLGRNLKWIDIDTSVFLTIARGITKGQVPFRDFYDNKGPLMYLISAPGMLIGGFAGVWITELFLMCVSVFFAYKTALFFGGRSAAFLGVACSFIVFQSFFYEVAGSEEYSLPFMMISLFIFTKYFFTKKEPPFYELIILGMCFSSVLLIRINHFPLWAGFCFVIVVELLIKKQWTQMLKCILGFSAGILLAGVPVFWYLMHNNALADYIRQNLLTGSSRAFDGFSVVKFVQSFFIIMSYLTQKQDFEYKSKVSETRP